MIHPRVRGLSLLHIGLQALMSVTVFWGWLLCYLVLLRSETPNWDRYIIYSLLVAAAFVVNLVRANLSDLNVLQLDLLGTHRVTIRQIFHILIVVLVYLVGSKDLTISRLFLGTFLVPLYLTLFFSNRFLPAFLARLFFSGRRIQRTLLCGSVADVERLGYWLKRKGMYGMQVVGLISSEGEPAAESNGSATNGAPPVLGTVGELEMIVASHRINQVILMRSYAPEELVALNDRCEDAGARLFVVHDLQERLGRPIRIFKDDGMAVIALRHEPLECPWNRLIKRAIDVSVALFVAIFLLPISALLVSLIHRIQSPGRLLFRQRRIGLHNEEFWIFKFRTMHAGETSEAQQATNGDERVFPLGRWLRRLSIDELPQFLNVLRGEMSIVGPRPHLSEHDLLFAKSTQAYRVRTFIKPGITGLAQVRGFRGETRTEQAIRARVQSDLHYVENWSPILDWLIIFRTAWQMIRPPQSAY